MEEILKITIGECECTSNFAVKILYYSLLALGATLLYLLLTNSITQAYVFGRIRSTGIKTTVECLVFFALILLYDLLIQSWRDSICFIDAN